MIKDLAKLATRLDRLGLTKEADVLDAALQKVAEDFAKQQADTAAARGAGIFSGGEDPFAAISDSKLPAGISGAVGNLRAPSRTQIGSGGLAARSPGFGASPGVAEMGRGDYEGLSTSPGKPGIATEGRAGGLASNPWIGFLHASPRSIAEFNDALALMFEKVPRTSNLVPADVRSNLPKGQSSWTPQTQKAFGVIANLAGYPEAGRPGGWAGPDGKSGWAQKNNYEPTMKGILKFWDDNKGKVIEKLFVELSEFAAAAQAQATAGFEKQQKQEGNILTTGGGTQGPRGEAWEAAKLPPPESPTDKEYKEQIKKYKEYEKVPRGNPDASGGTGIEESNLRALKRRIAFDVAAGTHIQIGAPGQKFFSTLATPINKKIDEVVRANPMAARWFTQNKPDVVIPTDAIKSYSVAKIKQYAAVSTNNDPGVGLVYDMIQELLDYKKRESPNTTNSGSYTVRQ